jgi:hypothetical protein
MSRVFKGSSLLTPNMGGRFVRPKKQGMLPVRNGARDKRNPDLRRRRRRRRNQGAKPSGVPRSGISASLRSYAERSGAGLLNEDLAPRYAELRSA